MATAGAVLGVIRASRPILRTAIERVAFAVHAAFLATGYSLVAVGAAANADANADGTEEPEVEFEGWNTLEGAYAFRYVGDGQSDLYKSVTLKIVVMVGSLMVDVAPTGTEILHHLEIRGSDFAKDGDGAGNYAQQFVSLEGLVKEINDMILSKLSPPKTMTSDNITSTSSTSLQNERINLVNKSDARRISAPPLLYDIQQSIGNPGSSGGIYAPRRDFDADEMLIGPNNARWRHSNGGLQPQFSNYEEPIIPSNARYDPIGPLDILGIDTIDYERSTNRPPNRHPDLEHF